MALIPPFFLDCVVAVGVGKDENIRWVASAFLYGSYISTDEGDNKNYSIWIVTNRHVFEGQKDVVFRFNPRAGEEPITAREPLVDHGGTPRWFAHPNDEVDVAVMQIRGPALTEMGIQFGFFPNDDLVARARDMAELGITEGDFAYVLGFPMGLVGAQRNTVIVRSGSIARIRDTIDDSMREFLIDASIFPGNSGGPVVLKPEMVAIRGTKNHLQAQLIGIIKSYVPYQDVAISAQTQRPRVIFEENSGLAAAHSVDCIEEAIQEAMTTLNKRQQ